MQKILRAPGLVMLGVCLALAATVYAGTSNVTQVTVEPTAADTYAIEARTAKGGTRTFSVTPAGLVQTGTAACTTATGANDICVNGDVDVTGSVNFGNGTLPLADLAPGAAATIPVVNAGGTAFVAVAVSGDATITAAGVLAIAPGVVIEGDLAAAMTVDCSPSLDFVAITSPETSNLTAQTCAGVAVGWPCSIAPDDGGMPANADTLVAFGDGAGTVTAIMGSFAGNVAEPAAEVYNLHCWAQ